MSDKLIIEDKADATVEVTNDAKPAAKAEPPAKVEVRAKAEPVAKAEPKPETKTEPKVEPESATQPAAKTETKTDEPPKPAAKNDGEQARTDAAPTSEQQSSLVLDDLPIDLTEKASAPAQRPQANNDEADSTPSPIDRGNADHEGPPVEEASKNGDGDIGSPIVRDDDTKPIVDSGTPARDDSAEPTNDKIIDDSPSAPPTPPQRPAGLAPAAPKAPDDSPPTLNSDDEVDQQKLENGGPPIKGANNGAATAPPVPETDDDVFGPGPEGYDPGIAINTAEDTDESSTDQAPVAKIEMRTDKPDFERPKAEKPKSDEPDEPQTLKEDPHAVLSTNDQPPSAKKGDEAKENGNEKADERQDREEDRGRDGSPIEGVDDGEPGSVDAPHDEELKRMVGNPVNSGSDGGTGTPGEGSTPPPQEAIDFIGDANAGIEDQLQIGDMSDADVNGLLNPSLEADVPDLPSNPNGDPSQGFIIDEHPNGGVQPDLTDGGGSQLSEGEFVDGYNRLVGLNNELRRQVRDGEATPAENGPYIDEANQALDNFAVKHDPDNVWVLESGGNLKDNLENGTDGEKFVAWNASPIKGDEVYSNYTTGELSDKKSLPADAHVVDGRSTIGDQEGTAGAGTPSRKPDMDAGDFLSFFKRSSEARESNANREREQEEAKKQQEEARKNAEESDDSASQPDSDISEAVKAQARAFEAENGLGGHNVGLIDEINVAGDFDTIDTTGGGESDDRTLTGGDDERVENHGGSTKEKPDSGNIDPSQDDDINTEANGPYINADVSVGAEEIQGTESLPAAQEAKSAAERFIARLTDTDTAELDTDDPEGLDADQQPHWDFGPNARVDYGVRDDQVDYGSGDSDGTDPTDGSADEPGDDTTDGAVDESSESWGTSGTDDDFGDESTMGDSEEFANEESTDSADGSETDDISEDIVT